MPDEEKQHVTENVVRIKTSIGEKISKRDIATLQILTTLVMIDFFFLRFSDLLKVTVQWCKKQDD